MVIQTFLLAALGFASVRGQGSQAVPVHKDFEFPVTILNNDKEFPLVGLGVGRDNDDELVDHVADAVGDGYYRLIDTNHEAGNEDLVREGIEAGIENSEEPDESIIVHVVTKVWYTYLGYERTMLSVKQSLANLQHENIRVHVLLHWPSCQDDVDWMDCEGEEEALPQEVKDAGPPPHLNKQNAWKDSWRALEELYEADNNLESIGISNFELEDLKELFDVAKIKPAIFQGNVWIYFHEDDTMDLLEENGVHFQAYNVMEGIVSNDPEEFPNSAELLDRVVDELEEIRDEQTERDEDDPAPAGIDLSEVVLAFLVQKDVSVVPSTGGEHLEVNSPEFIGSVPLIEGDHDRALFNIMKSLIMEADLEPPRGTFTNDHSENVHVYWKDPETDEEEPIALDLAPGEEISQVTEEGHEFVVYNADRSDKAYYQIQETMGETFDIRIEL